MRKILFLLISIPLIFNSCEKEEENQSNNNNNNSNLTLEQTMWDLKSSTITDNLTGFTYTRTYPDPNQYTISLKWTFFDNGTLIETVEKGYNTEFEDFPFTYSYFPENNKLYLYDDDEIQPSNYDFQIYGDIILTIIEHTSNNLICEWTDIDVQEGYNETFRGYFDKVN